MRNLKKVLSLALALVMLIGMMVIGAGAVETKFVDDGKIGDNYKEAVAVMSAIKVLGGKENNNFDPEGTLTRAEAAKILCVMTMGSDAAEGLASVTKSGVFTDMADHWAAGYVDACYNKGIVLGMDVGIYGPSNTLTGTQFAAMLLRAIGVEGEFTGPSWESAVIAAAGKAKLSEVTTKPIARQAASKMAFDGLLYSPSGEKAYKVGNLTFDNFLEAYIAADQDVEKIAVSTASDSLATTVFGLAEDAKTDAFGNPTKVWSYDNEDVVTVPGTAATKTYTEKKSDLSSDLKDFSFKDAKMYEDGKESPIADSANAATTVAGKTGNGTQVMVYASNKVISKVVVIHEYVGVVTKVTEAKGDAKRTVSIGTDKFETEDFEVGDVVIYTKADKSIKTMILADVAEGVSVTRKTGDTKFTAGGTDYAYSENIASSDKGDVKVGSVLDLYLDTEGNVIKVVVSKGTSDFAYVLDVRKTTGYTSETTYYAKLVLTDGTVVTDVMLDEDALTKANTGATQATPSKDQCLEALKTKIVEFTKDSKDVYTLVAKSAALDNSGNVVIENGRPGMTLNASTYYADSKTIFLVKSGDTWATYTGYAEVPTMRKAGGYFAVYNDGVAKIVVVADVPAETEDVVFVLGSKAGTYVVEEGMDPYYEYAAVVNGEITTVKAKATSSSVQALTTNNLYKSIVYSNKENEIIDFASSTQFDTVTANNKMTGWENVTKNFGNGTMGINSVNYAVDDDVQVFAVNDAAKIEIGDIDAATKAEVDPVKAAVQANAIIRNGKLVTLFYMVPASGSSENKPTTPAGTYDIDISDPTAVKVLVNKDATAEQKDEFAVLEEIVAAIKAKGFTVADGSATKSGDDWTIPAKKGAATQNYVWATDTDFAVDAITVYVGTSTTGKLMKATATIGDLGTGEHAKVSGSSSSSDDGFKPKATALVDGCTYDIGYYKITGVADVAEDDAAVVTGATAAKYSYTSAIGTGTIEKDGNNFYGKKDATIIITFKLKTASEIGAGKTDTITVTASGTVLDPTTGKATFADGTATDGVTTTVTVKIGTADATITLGGSNA